MGKHKRKQSISSNQHSSGDVHNKHKHKIIKTSKLKVSDLETISSKHVTSKTTAASSMPTASSKILASSILPADVINQTNVAVFKCSMCAEQFDRSWSLRLHIQSRHTVIIMSLKCPSCSKPYATKESMKKHIKKQHCKLRKNGNVNIKSLLQFKIKHPLCTINYTGAHSGKCSYFRSSFHLHIILRTYDFYISGHTYGSKLITYWLKEVTMDNSHFEEFYKQELMFVESDHLPLVHSIELSSTSEQNRMFLDALSLQLSNDSSIKLTRKIFYHWLATCDASESDSNYITTMNRQYSFTKIKHEALISIDNEDPDHSTINIDNHFTDYEELDHDQEHDPIDAGFITTDHAVDENEIDITKRAQQITHSPSNGNPYHKSS